MVIHKHPLQVGGKVSIEMPVGARVVKGGMQGGQPHIWVEKFQDTDTIHTTRQGWEIRSFDVFGTGWAIPKDARYIDTVFQSHYVWHIYEVPTNEGL